MPYHFKFNKLAQKEFEDAVHWYIDRSEKAAIGFVEAMNMSLEKVCTYPTRYRNTYKHFHEIGLNKYPFIIIYSIEATDKLIVIWKVFHNKRNPKKKYVGLKSKT